MKKKRSALLTLRFFHVFIKIIFLPNHVIDNNRSTLVYTHAVYLEMHQNAQSNQCNHNGCKYKQGENRFTFDEATIFFVIIANKKIGTAGKQRNDYYKTNKKINKHMLYFKKLIICNII